MLRYILFLSSFLIGSLRALTPQEIDQIAEQTLKEWNIPGLSLAVIHKDEPIQIKGYGVLESGSDKLVNTQTLFQINSLSKAFTTLTVDRLVKEGKIDWDIPITAYFPDFQSLDPEVTKSLSLRDLLSHQGGFPGNLYKGSRLFKNKGHSVEELVRRLAFVNLVFPFRTRFNYDNLGYAIASEVVAKVSGISWADYCHQHIFLPLNMTRTTTSYSKFSEDENATSPHKYPKAEKIEGYNWEKDSLEAASGINSCADDMAKWLIYCLNNPSEFLETQKPHIPIYPEDMVSETELPLFAMIAHGQPHMHYGLGWWSYQLDETSVYRHTGSSPGMQSVLAVIPEKQIGIVILNNMSHTPAMSCMMNILIDKLLERPDNEWHELGHQAFEQKDENEKK